MTGDGPATVLLVDDHPLVRQGLQAVLSVVDDITVVGEASDGRAAVELAAELDRNIVIMDLQLPVLHGIDATREIVAARPGTAVLVLTMFEDDDMVFSSGLGRSRRLPAQGRGRGRHRDRGPRRQRRPGRVRRSPRAAAAHLVHPRPAAAADPFPQLTAREREILDGVAAGLTNAQIGQQMFLSAKTVANNVSNILAKLHLAERGQAIVAARDAGLGRRPDGAPERS